MPDTQPKSTALRYLMSFIGILVMMAGTAIVTLSGLGTAPVSSPVWVATLIGGLSFGGWTFTLNLILIAAQFIMLRSNFPLSGWLQLPAVAFAGATLDGWMFVFRGLEQSHYLGQLGLVLLGTIILGFGVALLATSRALYLPGEGFVATVAEVTHTPFARVKIIFDLSCVSIAFLLAVVVLHDWAVIREATIISAFSLGPIVGFFMATVIQPFSRKTARA